MIIKERYLQDLANGVDAIFNEILVRAVGDGNYRILTVAKENTKRPPVKYFDVIRVYRSFIMSNYLTVQDLFFRSIEYVEVLDDETDEPLIMFHPYYMYQKPCRTTSCELNYGGSDTGEMLSTPSVFDSHLRGTNIDSLCKIALLRLEFPYGLTDKSKKRYEDYLQKNIINVFDLLFDEENLDSIFHFSSVFITNVNYPVLLEEIVSRKNATQITQVMQIINSLNFSSKSIIELPNDKKNMNVDKKNKNHRRLASSELTELLNSVEMKCDFLMDKLSYYDTTDLLNDGGYDDIITMALTLEAEGEEFFDDD